jgi:hypothetical protein
VDKHSILKQAMPTLNYIAKLILTTLSLQNPGFQEILKSPMPISPMYQEKYI